MDVGSKLVPDIGRIDALICYNDLIALGAMKQFAAAGIAIPDHLAIVGCDDIPAASLVGVRTRAARSRIVDARAAHPVTAIAIRELG